MYFILIQPVFSEHLSFVTLFKCSLGRLHKTYVWLYINNLRLRHFLEASNNFYNGNMVAIVCVFLLIIYILTCHQITSKQINKMKWYINIDIYYCTRTLLMIRIGECPSNSPFLKNNGTEAPKGPRPIGFKEWRDTRTFSNLKSTHCTLIILLIINLVTKKFK